MLLEVICKNQQMGLRDWRKQLRQRMNKPVVWRKRILKWRNNILITLEHKLITLPTQLRKLPEE